MSPECQPCPMALSTPTLHAVNSLGISEELKEKLRDVMVDRHKVALGKTLGEGESPAAYTHPSELLRSCTSTLPPHYGKYSPHGPSEVSVSLWPPTGEFGAVMEGQLNQDDSILKVAVKTMKSELYAHIWDPQPLPYAPEKEESRKVNSKLATA